jgi:outer membrane protein assembly factor BamB
MSLTVLSVRIILLALVTATSLASVQASQPPRPGEEPLRKRFDQNQGSLTHLAERLVRVREQETLLRTARSELAARRSGAAISALQQIFAAPADALEINPQNGLVASIRAQAIQLLTQASPGFQQDWMKTTATIAERDLASALASGELWDFQTVVHRYPLTEAGMRSAFIANTLQRLRGETAAADAQLRTLEAVYRSSVLESSFLALSHQLQRWPVLPGTDAPRQLAQTQLTLPIDRTEGQQTHVSSPWPVPLWQWNESIGSYPGVPQSSGFLQLSGFLPNANPGETEFANWQPAFWQDQIVLRSPFRLAGLNREDGRLLWSLTTDTWTPQQPPDSKAHLEAENPTGSFDLALSNSPYASRQTLRFHSAHGLMSCDSDTLYFVDGFDFFPESTNAGMFGNNRQRGRRVFPGRDDFPAPRRKRGSSLVALRITPEKIPELAWVIGEHQFSYRVQTIDPSSRPIAGRASDQRPSGTLNPEDNRPQQDISNPSRIATTRLQGHDFTSPPVGRGQSLFVLSVAGGQFFLNCIERTTGDLRWQQPLVFSQAPPMLGYNDSSQRDRTNVCLLHEDTVICSLSEGVLVGVQAVDGQLKWATAIDADPDTEDPEWRTQGYDPYGHVFQEVFVPFEGHGIVVCTDTGTERLCGVDAQTGRILWQVSRSVPGQGDSWSSHDRYVAGLTDTSVILIGERHCRSVELTTGVQNWVTPIPATVGRAVCGEGRCLLPAADGRIRIVRTSDGQMAGLENSESPEQAVRFSGALAVSDDLVCLANPVSLTVCRAADVIARQSSGNDAESVLIRCQALLANGEVAQVRHLLMERVRQSDPTDPSESRLTRLLADLILDEIGQQTASSLQNQSDPGTDTTAPGIPSARIDELESLALAPAQRLRSVVLKSLGTLQPPVQQSDLHVLQSLPDWNRPVRISRDWSIRPDVVFQTSNAKDISDLRGLSNSMIRHLVDQRILFPSSVRRIDDLALAELLAARGETAAAECLILRLISDPNEPNKSGSDFLQRLHSPDFWLPRNSPTGAEPTDIVAGPGLNSLTIGQLSLDSQYHLRVPMLELELAEKGLALHSLPSWNRMQYALIDGEPDENLRAIPQLVTIDPADGTQRDRMALEMSFGQNFREFHPLLDGHSTPGLMPILGSDQLVMMSCPASGRLQQLWSRPLPKDALSVVEFGSLGHDHFVWHDGVELHVTSPLTGRDLWTRRIPLPVVEDPPDGVRRLFGDNSVTLVMHPDFAGFDRYRTRDGMFLGTGTLPTKTLDGAGTIGNCLLHVSPEGRLHLFDGTTLDDALADEAEIPLSVHPFHRSWCSLPDGKVLVAATSADGHELVLVDTKTGQVRFRTSLRSQLATDFVFGLTAFERDGSIYVVVEDIDDDGLPIISVTQRRGETAISTGTMLRLDPITGRILWKQQVQSGFAPHIGGDLTDLMMIWRLHRNRGDALQRLEEPSPLKVVLLNKANGAVVGEASCHCTSIPIRCTHNAKDSHIQLFSRDTIFTLRSETPADAKDSP